MNCLLQKPQPVSASKWRSADKESLCQQNFTTAADDYECNLAE